MIVAPNFSNALQEPKIDPTLIAVNQLIARTKAENERENKISVLYAEWSQMSKKSLVDRYVWLSLARESFLWIRSSGSINHVEEIFT